MNFSVSRYFLKVMVLLLIAGNTQKSYCDSDSGAQTFLAVAGGVAAGACLGKMISTFCVSNDRLIDDSCKELALAEACKKQIEVLKEFEIDKKSNIEKKQYAYTFNEDLAAKISSASPFKVINYAYVKELNSLISNMKFYQTKCIKRARRYETIKKEKDKYGHLVPDLKKLIEKFNEVLPSLEFLQLYINSHKFYFEMDEFAEAISKQYAKEIKLLSAQNCASVIKRTVRVKLGSSRYPLIDYVSYINADMSRLDKFVYKAANRYPDLIQDSKALRNDLVCIRDCIVGDREYSAEQRDLEYERQQQAICDGMFVLGTTVGIATAPRTKTYVVPSKKRIIKEVTFIEED